MPVKAPIVEAIVELKFNGNLPVQVLIGMLYQEFGEEFTRIVDLPILQLPIEVRQSDPNLINQPLYKIVGENFVLNVGENLIGICAAIDRENKFYPGWDVFGGFAEKVIAFLYSSKAVSSVNQVDVRYINYFESVGITDKANVTVNVTGKEVTNNLTIFFEDQVDDSTVKIQMASKANLKSEKMELEGSIVDIDVTEKVEITDSKALSEKVNRLHAIAEDTFFNIVKSEALSEGVVRRQQ